MASSGRFPSRDAMGWLYLCMGRLTNLSPFAVCAEQGISYSISGTPDGIPSRLSIPNTWDVKDTWKVGVADHVLMLQTFCCEL
jgi:hypothetical protein